MLTMFATDAAESVDDFGNWAIGRNFALSPGERLAVAANARSDAPLVPSPIAVATAAIPAAMVKKLIGVVDFSTGMFFFPSATTLRRVPELHNPPRECSGDRHLGRRPGWRH